MSGKAAEQPEAAEGKAWKSGGKLLEILVNLKWVGGFRGHPPDKPWLGILGILTKNYSPLWVEFLVKKP